MKDLIFKNVLLSDKNWFRTGGDAEFFAEPKNLDNFKEIIKFSNDKNLKISIIGDGANILVNDDGVSGIVIHPSGKKIEIGNITVDNYVYVKAGSGVLIDDLIFYCLNNNIIGLEEFSGIPGSVGGSIYINIHYFKFFISMFVESATVIEIASGNVFEVEKNWFDFGYDSSKLFEKKHIVIDVTFKFKKVDFVEAAYAKGRSLEIIRHRKERYPYKGTCGCFFRNLNEDEVNFEVNGKKILAAGYYLEKVGVKGELRKGDVCVSHKHANMIVNEGQGKTEDILFLANEMGKRVFEKFGLKLHPECQFFGF
jgi:UDP-N-acetylmuramate dehydrogenase